MKGHLLDHGDLKAFIGPDHKLHKDNVDISPLYNAEKRDFSVRASYFFSFL